jgi:hypothetical protein
MTWPLSRNRRALPLIKVNHVFAKQGGAPVAQPFAGWGEGRMSTGLELLLVGLAEFASLDRLDHDVPLGMRQLYKVIPLTNTYLVRVNLNCRALATGRAKRVGLSHIAAKII